MIFFDVPPPIIAVVDTDTSGQEIIIQVENDGIALTNLRVNGNVPQTSGEYAGWVVTNNATNTVSFNYNAPAGSVITLTDQRGNVLGTWDIAADTMDGTISDSFTLPDGIGNYYLTVLLTAPDSETREIMIPVKYIAIDGGDVCDQDPLPPECLPPQPPDVGEPGTPDVPSTGLRYVYIGGYAIPAYWVIVSMLGVFGIATLFFVYKNAQKHIVRFDKKVTGNGQEKKK